MKSKTAKSSILAISVICIVLGTLIGAGVAYADVAEDDLYVGQFWYYNYHEYVQGDPPWWDWWHYYLENDIEMSADRTEVTVYSTGYLLGGASSGFIFFGPLWIYDEHGHESQLYYAYLGLPIDDAYDEEEDTFWTYDEMDSGNNYVVVHQIILEFVPPFYAYQLGVDYTCYKTQ